MADDLPLEPRFVVWLCDHCGKGIKFDVVQLAGRAECRVKCPYCEQETRVQEPPPPPPLVRDEGWTEPSVGENAAPPAPAEVAAESVAELAEAPPTAPSAPASRPKPPGDP